ncbi:unnamed protein product [Spirodela intermedia]|uniref:Uncharacterized protein n=1 Tax=Spirodela intermedia TaxID=51605 RepID=A0A7I8JSM2_SPIIN|nr:unnamed protein product [Spirodela intermedia]CAA6673197.1 unnamed protein product [Spirodela intermedia]
MLKMIPRKCWYVNVSTIDQAGPYCEFGIG